MNDLLRAMSNDMEIHRYTGEAEYSFIYRLCYSALGQWCLYTAMNSSGDITGTTKINQTVVLKDLLMRFSELFPSISDRFINTNSQQLTYPAHVRNVYEETGYLLTDENNRNYMANYGRCISIGDNVLFFGLPNTKCSMNGLGVFKETTVFKVTTKEFLIRDDLTYEEYFQSQFDLVDFYDRDIDLDELEFFNPKSNKIPSQSWEKRPQTDYTLARKSELGPFYRIMQMGKDIQFADEPVEQQNDNFTSYEYRRVIFALKAHYEKPLKAIITKQDDEYSKIRLRGQLPNREYYYMLLLSWPENNAFDKVNFLIRNKLLPEIASVLEDIGIEICGG